MFSVQLCTFQRSRIDQVPAVSSEAPVNCELNSLRMLSYGLV
jgi:hypothetical protein